MKLIGVERSGTDAVDSDGERTSDVGADGEVAARAAPPPEDLLLGEVVRAQLPWMLGVARALTGSLDAAEGLVQDAIVRALPHAEGWIHSPRAYLRRTMTNLHIDDLRRRKLITFVPDPELQVGTAVALPDVALQLDIANLLADMPPMLRLVLVHRFLEDLSTTQVADLIGQTPGSVRRLTHQALQLLRQNTEEAGK